MTTPPAAPRTLLADLLHQRYWTVEDFVGEFAKAARSLPRSAATHKRMTDVCDRQAKRWLAGTVTQPRPSASRVLEAMFGRPAAELLRPPTAGRPAPTARPGAVPSPQSPAGQPPPATGEAATNRRTVVELAAAALVTGAAPHLDPTARLAALDRTAAGDGAVSTAEHALRTVVADYLHQPPTATLARVTAVQRLTDGVAAEYVLRPADTARLWTTAAIAAGIRGWIENNLGHPDAARLSLREAHRRGELLDDHQIVAWVRYMQATVEDYAGNPDAARRYALDGIAHTRPDSPQRAILLVDSLAGVLAIHGDTDGVHRAIDQAHTVISNLPAEQITSPGIPRMIVDDMTTLGASRFTQQAGKAYARLGHPDRFADVTSEPETDAEQPGDSGPLAVYRADEALAFARATTPDIEHARTLASQALTLARPFQTAHVGHRIDAVVTAAGTTPAARDLAEEVRSWRAARAVPAVAALA